MEQVIPHNYDFRSWRESSHLPNELTIGRLIGFLLNKPDFADSIQHKNSLPAREGDPGLCYRHEPPRDAIFSWPPDVFAICAALLRKSGCYASFSHHDLGSKFKKEKFLEQRSNLVAAWQYRAVCVHSTLDTERPSSDFKDSQVLLELWSYWKEIWKHLDLPLSSLADNPKLVCHLMIVMSIADESCENVGLPIRPNQGNKEDLLYREPFLDMAMDLLTPGAFGSSLCRYIHPSVARVLPKTHVPVAGLTVRSMSRHLAYCESEEIQPRWFLVPGARGNVNETHSFNVLVVPWPLSIDPKQILKVKKADTNGEKIDGFRGPNDPEHQYFTYQSQPAEESLIDVVERLCDEAAEKVKSLDAIVLPELAATRKEYNDLRHRLLRRKILLICGIGKAAVPPGLDPGEQGDNFLSIDVPLSDTHAVHFIQSKHHRWRIDGKQIKQYGLGSSFNPKDVFWEDISVADRRLLFLVLRPWLVTSTFICEDLARHDPVGELVGGVGPHLLIALLMDGPQLAVRWPARYAAALADDPGCSVLTVTSAGMSSLTKGEHGGEKTRRIALWKDQSMGSPRELELPAATRGLLLSLTVCPSRESTPDNRHFDATYPTLSGVHFVTGNARPKRSTDNRKIEWLSPNDALSLARLAQLRPDAEGFRKVLSTLSGEAKLIGLAMLDAWKYSRTSEKEHQHDRPNREEDWQTLGVLPEEYYSEAPQERHRNTAKEILIWGDTNAVRRP